MTELLSQRIMTRLRRMTVATLCALPFGGLAAPVLAQNVSAGLRACTAERDSARRLACYDREMARLATPPAPAPAAAPTPPAAPPAQASAPHHLTWKIFDGGSSSRVTARVASLDRWPDAMVLHLDNGQVWQQIGRASGDLSLQVGDSVTIEKHLGSYWLSSRHVSNMQVRLKPQ